MINHRKLAAQARWEGPSKSSRYKRGVPRRDIEAGELGRHSPQIINLYVHFNQTARVQ
jgi:hypothetical protein